MKAFWSILGLLVIALAVMLVLRGRSVPSAPAPSPTAAAPIVAAPDAPAPPPTSPPTSPPASPSTTPPSAPSLVTDDSTSATTDTPPPPPQVRATPDGFEVVPTPLPPTPAPTPSPSPSPSSPTPDSRPLQHPTPDSPPAPTPPTPPTPDDSALSESTDPILQAINEQITGKPATPAPSSSSPTPALPAPAPASASSAPLPPAKIIKQDDGSTLVDDRYVMKGAGTKADPYRITWEHLVSAELVYQPRLGRKQLPERIKMLDGKWVRLSGYIAFPIMANTQDEMLMMLNQWDGCCIGVPPTPYDAVEVNLNAAAKGDTRLRATGTVQGILRVDPYLVKDWLVSLYLMDNADLVESGGMQPAESPVHGK